MLQMKGSICIYVNDFPVLCYNEDTEIVISQKESVFIREQCCSIEFLFLAGYQILCYM